MNERESAAPGAGEHTSDSKQAVVTTRHRTNRIDVLLRGSAAPCCAATATHAHYNPSRRSVSRPPAPRCGQQSPPGRHMHTRRCGGAGRPPRRPSRSAPTSRWPMEYIQSRPLLLSSSWLSDGLRATGAATLRLEPPAEPPLSFAPISNASVSVDRILLTKIDRTTAGRDCAAGSSGGRLWAGGAGLSSRRR